MISKHRFFKELREFVFQLFSDVLSSTASEFLGTRLEEWYEKRAKKKTPNKEESEEE